MASLLAAQATAGAGAEDPILELFVGYRGKIVSWKFS